MGLGLAIHFVIARAAAAVFAMAARRWPGLLRWVRLTGPWYGAVAWLAMQAGVLPLTALQRAATFPPPGWEPGLVAHVLCVGLPIAWVTRRMTVRR